MLPTSGKVRPRHKQANISRSRRPSRSAALSSSKAAAVRATATAPLVSCIQAVDNPRLARGMTDKVVAICGDELGVAAEKWR